METRANYALVGLFTLAVLGAAFGFVSWFSGLGGSSDRREVRIVFSGSVTGLTRGSSVLFNGLRVGEVKDIQLFPDDPRFIYAVVDVAASTPIRDDTRARIESQGLAGVVAIQLLGGKFDAAQLQAKEGQPLPTIIAERSEVQDLLETVRNVARRTDDLFERLGRFVDDNDKSIATTIRNVEKFSAALGDNADGVNKMLASIATAAERIGPLATQLESFTRDLSAITRQIDTDRINRTLENVDRFAAALGTGSGDVTKTLQSVAGITEKLNRAADQVEGVLKGAQAFLGSAAGGEGQGALADVGAAARSIRVLADNLDKRTAEITTGISRFTGPGLRDIEALANDGRKTLNDLNRTLRSFERNPQQLIFGNRPAIPDYNGRR
ncbi:MAG: MlaD family protein [Beijerinckiaceae bacterium]|jgi:phospholipid/cholesterol/gamma-HCH transport system substrate-binding protein|nr:MlaD family protein [Beijerinckiaceae bacterium]